jgi:hypothetical protein
MELHWLAFRLRRNLPQAHLWFHIAIARGTLIVCFPSGKNYHYVNFFLDSHALYGTLCTMTYRNEVKARVRSPLTDLENEIMQIIWSHGASSVEAVHAALVPSRKLKESSVRTMLRRLEKKGYLSHESRDRAYIYSAGETPHSLAARAVRQIMG